eukprot:TRINITY_DN3831_c0_g1_i1.p1 TRINITY_DN3831_c0_g1~~TRINITY_DN3831_c0_g1_i1.p1  ORF type:complete len:1002 (+),score=253.35 TRINITY_DN3831_c0_g1_i1:715-3720(+)
MLIVKMLGFLLVGSFFESVPAVDEMSHGEGTVLYEFDKEYESQRDDLPIVILYGVPGTELFSKLHKELVVLCKDGKIRYVYRHWDRDYEKKDVISVQGYGIELALKSVEYKVIDQSEAEESGAEETVLDNVVQGMDFEILSKRYPGLSSELLSYKASLSSGKFNMEELKVWEIKDLAFKATDAIISSENPIKMMQDISQNLPTLAHTLARTQIDPAKEQRYNILSKSLEEYSELFAINNKQIDLYNTDIYQIYDILAKQIDKYNAIKKIGVSQEHIEKIMSLRPPENNPIYINLDSDLVDYVNDLERDRRYARFNPSVQDLLKGVYPGQLHFIRKNLWNIITVVDLGNRDGIHAMAQMISLMNRNLPARFGFYFSNSNEDSELGIRMWKHLRTMSLSGAANFITNVDLELTKVPTVREALVAAFGSATKVPVDDILNNQDITAWMEKSKEYLQQKGASTTKFLTTLNGEVLDINPQTDITQSLVRALFMSRNELQIMVRTKQITDDSNIYNYILSQREVFKSYNEYVLSANQFLPVSNYDTLFNSISYFIDKESEFEIKEVSHIGIADFNTKEGISFVNDLFSRLLDEEDKSHLRIAIFPSNADDSKMKLCFAVPKLNLGIELSRDILTANTLEESFDRITDESLKTTLKEMMDSEEISNLAKNFKKFLKENISEKSSRILISNSKLVVVPNGSYFSADDIGLQEIYSFRNNIQHITAIIEELSYDVSPDDVTSSFISNIIQYLTSLLNRDPASILPDLDFVQPSFVVNSDSTGPITLTAILDPLSVSTQKISSILLYLAESLNAKLTVYLKPQTLSTMPLKNFFKYSLSPLKFTDSGRIQYGTVEFLSLPQNTLLSTNVHSPSSWLVTSKYSPYDLDNIVLQDLPQNEQSLYAVFELENILIEGSCADLSNNHIPPRGLGLVLGDYEDDYKSDTLVMSNLGYFQLKSNPGIWKLSLAPGVADDIYEIKNTNDFIAVDSFLGHTEKLLVKKKTWQGTRFLV